MDARQHADIDPDRADLLGPAPIDALAAVQDAAANLFATAGSRRLRMTRLAARGVLLGLSAVKCGSTSAFSAAVASIALVLLRLWLPRRSRLPSKGARPTVFERASSLGGGMKSLLGLPASCEQLQLQIAQLLADLVRPCDAPSTSLLLADSSASRLNHQHGVGGAGHDELEPAVGHIGIVGLTTSWPSIKPICTPPTGPWNGMS